MRTPIQETREALWGNVRNHFLAAVDTALLGGNSKGAVVARGKLLRDIVKLAYQSGLDHGLSHDTYHRSTPRGPGRG